MALLDGVRSLMVAKGAKVTRIDLANERPDDDTLASLLLGPTGNLRAPTVRQAHLMLVGFNAEMYKALAGG